MKYPYHYNSKDPRFCTGEELTFKDMLLRYRTRGWDVRSDGTRMTVNEIQDEILAYGVYCLD